MKASTDRLKECYVSPSSKRDDVTEPMWLYEEGMQDDGKALQVVFSNTLWAVIVSEQVLCHCFFADLPRWQAYLDSLEHGNMTLGHVRKATEGKLRA